MIVRWDSKRARDRDFAEKIHKHAVLKKAKSGTHYHATAYYLKKRTKKKQGEPMPTFDGKAGAMVLVF